jgi:hypothetical protein
MFRLLPGIYDIVPSTRTVKSQVKDKSKAGQNQVALKRDPTQARN